MENTKAGVRYKVPDDIINAAHGLAQNLLLQVMTDIDDHESLQERTALIQIVAGHLFANLAFNSSQQVGFSFEAMLKDVIIPAIAREFEFIKHEFAQGHMEEIDTRLPSNQPPGPRSPVQN